MRDYLRAVAAVARKDLVLELRDKRNVSSTLVFALLIVVVFAFVFGQEGDAGIVARGALWIAVVFAGTVGVTRAITTEGENRAVEGLMLAPVDRSAVYLGKVVSTTVFVTVVGWLSLVFVGVFLDHAFGSAFVPVALVVPLGAVGFCAVGVLLAFVTLESPLQESVLPVLLVPLVVPVILAGVELSLNPGDGDWLRLLVIYDGLVLVTGWATFDYVIEE